MTKFVSTLDLAAHFQKHGFAVLVKCLSAETVARFVDLTGPARESRDSEFPARDRIVVRHTLSATYSTGD